MKIGFTGVPPLQVIKNLKIKYPDALWIDLDVLQKNTDIQNSKKYIPDTSCSIIQTILSNALFIKPEIIIATTGPCKCDSMRFIVPILKNELENTKILEFNNNDKKNYGVSISGSMLPLRNKIEKITSNVLNFDKTETVHKISSPLAGFWGVPPFDFRVLDLFPDNTHVYGWTRCMENKTPDNMELELFVDKNVPTVFYSQAFCSKNILAKELARKNKGLYVEIDGYMDNSTKSKITAFLELNNCYL